MRHPTSVGASLVACWRPVWGAFDRACHVQRTEHPHRQASRSSRRSRPLQRHSQRASRSLRTRQAPWSPRTGPRSEASQHQTVGDTAAGRTCSVTTAPSPGRRRFRSSCTTCWETRLPVHRFPSSTSRTRTSPARCGWLARHGYTAVTLRSVWDHWHGRGSLSSRPVVVGELEGQPLRRPPPDCAPAAATTPRSTPAPVHRYQAVSRPLVDRLGPDRRWPHGYRTHHPRRRRTASHLRPLCFGSRARRGSVDRNVQRGHSSAASTRPFVAATHDGGSLRRQRRRSERTARCPDDRGALSDLTPRRALEPAGRGCLGLRRHARRRLRLGRAERGRPRASPLERREVARGGGRAGGRSVGTPRPSASGRDARGLPAQARSAARRCKGLGDRPADRQRRDGDQARRPRGADHTRGGRP